MDCKQLLVLRVLIYPSAIDSRGLPADMFAYGSWLELMVPVEEWEKRETTGQ